uniref:MFS domain-containing protein n=1 Tax=Heterorhabditis bacteriophora TaxID=37862 RepID=A0A1I7XIS9_HETBA
MLSKNLMLSLILNAVFGVYAVLEILLYSANPESIGKMFNISVQNHYRAPLSDLGFLLGASIALLQILSALVLSVEAYWMASFLSGLLIPIRINATMLFLSECAPDKHRGFALSSVIFGNALGNAITYTLSRNGWLGGDMWPYISLISLILSIILFFSTWWLPESPKWLVSKSKFDKAAQSIKFYHGKKADIGEV